MSQFSTISSSFREKTPIPDSSGSARTSVFLHQENVVKTVPQMTIESYFRRTPGPNEDVSGNDSKCFSMLKDSSLKSSLQQRQILHRASTPISDSYGTENKVFPLSRDTVVKPPQFSPNSSFTPTSDSYKKKCKMPTQNGNVRSKISPCQSAFVFFDFMSFADTLFISSSRSRGKKICQLLLLSTVIVLLWILFTSTKKVSYLKDLSSPDENININEYYNMETNWKTKLDQQIQVLLEEKWPGLLNQLESKWKDSSQEMNHWQKSLLDRVKDIATANKETAEEVAQLHAQLLGQCSSLQSEKDLPESSKTETLKELVSRLNNLEEKTKYIENNILKQEMWCKEQTSLNTRLSSLVQELQMAVKGNSDNIISIPIHKQIETIVKNAINRYDSDKTGLVDYALETSGGRVLNIRDTDTYAHGSTQFTIFGVPFWKSKNSPRAILQPQVHPGECWAMHGSRGKIVIQLFASIHPTAFSLEHIPKSLDPKGNIDTAPKEFSVLGLSSADDLGGKLLGKYIYSKDGDPLQIFNVQNPGLVTFSIVELQVHSNYGNTEYTCIYRFRVHGVQP